MFRKKHLVILAALGTCLLATQIPAANAKTMSVQVKESHLRATPAYFGAVLAPVQYGQRVTVLDTKGSWLKVRGPAGHATGWIHSAVLTERRIKLQTGDRAAAATVSSGELSAAEKGFTEQIEKDYKAKNRQVDFTWVDKMETIKVSPEKCRQFMQQGELRQLEGGAK